MIFVYGFNTIGQNFPQMGLLPRWQTLSGHCPQVVRSACAKRVRAVWCSCENSSKYAQIVATDEAADTLGKLSAAELADTLKGVSVFRGVFCENTQQIVADTCPRTLFIFTCGNDGQRPPPYGGVSGVFTHRAVRRENRGIRPNS